MNIGYDQILVELMINQEGIHQLLVMNLSSMNKIISRPEKLNEKRNELL